MKSVALFPADRAALINALRGLTEEVESFLDGLPGQLAAARVLGDLLDQPGPQLFGFFASLDLDALGSPVSWAGPEPKPVWLDVTRDYTKRWMAVRVGLDESDGWRMFTRGLMPEEAQRRRDTFPGESDQQLLG